MEATRLVQFLLYFTLLYHVILEAEGRVMGNNKWYQFLYGRLAAADFTHLTGVADQHLLPQINMA